MELGEFFSLPKYHRRSFIGFVVLIAAFLVLLAAICSWIRGPVAEFLFLLFMHLLSGVVASGLIVFFVAFFIPERQRFDRVVEIPPAEINAEFHKLMSTARRWFYSGNFGRFLRSAILKKLAGRTAVSVEVHILDPRDRALCEKHAEYRNHIRTADGKMDYTADDVALQPVVTLIYCAWYIRRRSMNIAVSLAKIFDPVRMDATDDAMILTVEDRQRPALKIVADYFMFEHFMLEQRYLGDQAEKLDLSGFPDRETLRHVTERDVETFMTKLGMKHLCNRLTPAAIIKEVQKDADPYEP